MKAILLASTNPAKRKMLAWLLEGLGLRPLGPETLPLSPHVEETGATHRENAALKAQGWSRAFGSLAIASDGGLLIPALGSAWDSLHTARFAGHGADDRQRLEKLLELMAPYQGADRRATWVEAVALAQAGKLLNVWEARGGDGLLADSYDPARIVPGFWVATVWYFPQLGRSFAQLTDEERRQLAEPWSLLKPRVQGFFRQDDRARDT